MTGSITYQAALDEIIEAKNAGQTISQSRFQEIVQSLNAVGDPSRTTTVFYSGAYVENTQAFRAALSLAEQSNDIRIIDQTDVGRFLSNNIVREEIARSVTGTTDFDSPDFRAFIGGGADRVTNPVRRGGGRKPDQNIHALT